MERSGVTGKSLHQVSASRRDASVIDAINSPALIRPIYPICPINTVELRSIGFIDEPFRAHRVLTGYGAKRSDRKESAPSLSVPEGCLSDRCINSPALIRPTSIPLRFSNKTIWKAKSLDILAMFNGDFLICLSFKISFADAVRRTSCRSTDCESSGTKARKCSVFTF